MRAQTTTRAASVIWNALSINKAAAVENSVAGKCHDGAWITRAAQGEAQAAAAAAAAVKGRGNHPRPPWLRLDEKDRLAKMVVDAGVLVKGVRGRVWSSGGGSGRGSGSVSGGGGGGGGGREGGGGHRGAGPCCIFTARTPPRRGAVRFAARSMATASDATITPQKRVRARAQLESQTRKTAIVRTRQEAQLAVDFLLSLPPTTVFACDTETTGIDPKVESPVGSGRVVCLSVYAGDKVDFNLIGGGKLRTELGTDPAEASRCLWVDTLEDEGVLVEFRRFLECQDSLKAWHNYSFDRHVLSNHGIQCRGLAGDTIHMARMWNSSFSAIHGGGGYSLSALSFDLLGWGKTDMKKLFGRHGVTAKGNESKAITLQDPVDIQRDPDQFEPWVYYSTLDAKVTFWLYELLRCQLRAMEWKPDPAMFESEAKMDEATKGGMLALYEGWWRDFGELLVDIEQRGIHVDEVYLEAQGAKARDDVSSITSEFLEWAGRNVCEDAALMNLASNKQKNQLFFGGMMVKVAKAGKLEAPPITASAGQVLDVPWVVGQELIRKGIADFEPSEEWGQTIEEAEFRVQETENVDMYVEEGRDKPRRMRSIKLSSLKLRPLGYTATGGASCSGPVLKQLAGDPFQDPPKYGKALESFDHDPEFGKEVCRMIAKLVNASAISTILNTFLSGLPGKLRNGRVHTSLNINTETGRLSSQRPNLQNQPALEKDVYGVRKAFCAPPGRKLIVADYGQLELRIMAHMTRCTTMIEALEAGGDFHSRTAMDMYDNVKEACDKGEVLLEWDKSKGEAPVPMLKEQFASERRKAKTLNFSIAYGKTNFGLAKDWGVTTREATETIDKWYAARKEVREWQDNARSEAAKTLFTTTLLGRKRLVPDMALSGPKAGHAGRTVINTPIQGGAADIVAMAMIKIHKNPRLSELGWHMVLQIHDELIMEGPEESSEEAFRLVKECMESPLARPLLVALPVDGSIAQTWYEGK